MQEQGDLQLSRAPAPGLWGCISTRRPSYGLSSQFLVHTQAPWNELGRKAQAVATVGFTLDQRAGPELTHVYGWEVGCIWLRFLREGSPQIRPEGPDLGKYPYFPRKPVLMGPQSWEPQPYFRNGILWLRRSHTRSSLWSLRSCHPHSGFSQCAVSSVSGFCYTKWSTLYPGHEFHQPQLSCYLSIN